MDRVSRASMCGRMHGEWTIQIKHALSIGSIGTVSPKNNGKLNLLSRVDIAHCVMQPTIFKQIMTITQCGFEVFCAASTIVGLDYWATTLKGSSVRPTIFVELNRRK